MKYIAAILAFVGTGIFSAHAQGLGDPYAAKACEGFSLGALICVSSGLLAPLVHIC